MRVPSALVLVMCASPVVAEVGGDDLIILRGDANHSGAVDSSDVSALANWLYSGGPKPPCMNEADVNHDGTVNGSDPVYLANFLFQGGPEPPAPGAYNWVCTQSASPVISCEAGCY